MLASLSDEYLKRLEGYLKAADADRLGESTGGSTPDAQPGRLEEFIFIVDPLLRKFVCPYDTCKVWEVGTPN